MNRFKNANTCFLYVLVLPTGYNTENTIRICNLPKITISYPRRISPRNWNIRCLCWLGMDVSKTLQFIPVKSVLVRDMKNLQSFENSCKKDRKYVISPKIWKLNFVSAKISRTKRKYIVRWNNWIRRRNGFDISKRKLNCGKYVFYFGAEFEVKLENIKTRERYLGKPS